MRSFEKAIELWLVSLDLTKAANHNLATRLLQRQRGAVRLRGEEFAIGDLAYKPEVTAEVSNKVTGDTDTVVVEPADQNYVRSAGADEQRRRILVEKKGNISNPS